MSDFLSDNQENVCPSEKRLSLKQVEESINEINVEVEFKKIKSLSKLDNRDANSSIVIPKENLTGLISRLASLSKLDCRKECSTGNTSQTTTCHPESNKNLTKSKKHRDTMLLDQRLNIQEILNDKNSLLLTEDNILERSDMSRDDHLLKMSDKKGEIPNINNFHNMSFSLDEPIEVNLTESNLPNDLKLSNQFDTFKKKLNSRNDETPSTSRFTDKYKSSPKKNFKTEANTPKKISLKKKLNTSIREQSLKPKNNLETKSTVLNSLKNSINSKSKSPVGFKNVNPFATSRVTFTPNSKLKLSNNKKPTTNIKKPVPPFGSDKKFTKPSPLLKQNTLNTSINRSYSKNTKPFGEGSRNLKSVNSSRLDTLNTSMSKKKKKSETLISHSSMHSTEFNVIEEYDYHKILTELRAIFGENLEFFDENSKYNFYFKL